MARASAPLILVATLGFGIGLGMVAGRLGSFPSVQARPLPQQPPASPAQTKTVGDDAVYDELRNQYEQFRHVNRTFELVARAVSPAVVHIVAKKPARRDEEAHRPQFEETGSGVIVRPERGRGLYVLTNNHVVEGATADLVTITLQDGRVVDTERYWADTKADIAVLKLKRDDLPAARLGNSDEAAVGSWVMALGSPFGLTHSVSQGIISARNRHEEELEADGVQNQQFLQTDAAINPGNSGGPLVNMKGEVIGINTAIASNGGGSEGVGFSIPINLAKWILSQFVERGRVSRGAMGVRLEEIRPHDAVAMGLERPRGARIKLIQRPSPAADAGFHEGDVVLRFNGVEVLDLNHLINLVSMSPIGQRAEVVFWRDRRAYTAQVAIADRDTVVQEEPGSSESATNPNGPLRRPARP
jgi:serine protease Do